jgi:hypothetical protein
MHFKTCASAHLRLSHSVATIERHCPENFDLRTYILLLKRLRQPVLIVQGSRFLAQRPASCMRHQRRSYCRLTFPPCRAAPNAPPISAKSPQIHHQRGRSGRFMEEGHPPSPMPSPVRPLASRFQSSGIWSGRKYRQDVRILLRESAPSKNILWSLQ